MMKELLKLHQKTISLMMAYAANLIVVGERSSFLSADSQRAAISAYFVNNLLKQLPTLLRLLLFALSVRIEEKSLLANRFDVFVL
jgi:hypothetical protein